MDYKRFIDPLTGKSAETGIVRASDGAFIPADPRYADWRAYQAWLKAGHTPAEPDAVGHVSAAPAR